MKRTEMIELMDEMETIGDFNCHICPPNENYVQVTSNYDYEQKGLLKTPVSCLTSNIFKLASIGFARYFDLKVVGRKNLKYVKKTGAILTCNHVHKLDCTLIRYATTRRKLKIIVGEFNNFKGFGGKVLRSACTMPLSKDIKCIKNLYKATGNFLDKKELILFYPEGSLWYCYEKPRPLNSGAYHFAVKFNVPVVPMFFTFKNKKKRKDGTYVKQFILHIGKPIYKQNDLTDKENIQVLKKANELFNKNVYEEFYKKSLVYKNEVKH